MWMVYDLQRSITCIPGCTSDRAYADECSLGHQFLPSELINPVSCLSGKKPILKEIENWYFDLDHCIDMMKEYNDFLRRSTNTRKYQLETVEEFLKKPLVYVPRKTLKISRSYPCGCHAIG